MSYQQQLQSLIDKKYTVGIDVSTWQANIKPINYQDIIQQQPYVSFVCVKATDGLSVDSKFQENFNNGVSANFCTGAYQFFDEAGDPIHQAELFYATAKQAQFIALDYEKRKVQQMAADQCFEKFAARVQQLFQMKPFIYMYPGFEHFPKEFAQYQPWVACYNPGLNYATLSSAMDRNQTMAICRNGCKSKIAQWSYL